MKSFCLYFLSCYITYHTNHSLLLLPYVKSIPNIECFARCNSVKQLDFFIIFMLYCIIIRCLTVAVISNFVLKNEIVVCIVIFDKETYKISQKIFAIY